MLISESLSGLGIESPSVTHSHAVLLCEQSHEERWRTEGKSSHRSHRPLPPLPPPSAQRNTHSAEGSASHSSSLRDIVRLQSSLPASLSSHLVRQGWRNYGLQWQRVEGGWINSEMQFGGEGDSRLTDCVLLEGERGSEGEGSSSASRLKCALRGVWKWAGEQHSHPLLERGWARARRAA